MRYILGSKEAGTQGQEAEIEEEEKGGGIRDGISGMKVNGLCDYVYSLRNEKEMNSLHQSTFSREVKLFLPSTIEQILSKTARVA